MQNSMHEKHLYNQPMKFSNNAVWLGLGVNSITYWILVESIPTAIIFVSIDRTVRASVHMCENRDFVVLINMLTQFAYPHFLGCMIRCCVS